ncbi:Beta-cyclopiazonate dehydrogenase [Cercospora beticola]|uniref:Beta-cyclopiazonate dehydrogenase n=1 Tax=Cercospora beticola TaxID=122368 RepID=A0A2G5I111_CERBT|nr:Beta-cyclopiazonate dehydrogenase [Cercospora beticola]PIA98431.1 Beta-cyclopiazonate dehydrogenase [Cercospora beticola]WPA99144.1 hypothetical protein RHO25_003760 [Cercospora beticola]
MARVLVAVIALASFCHAVIREEDFAAEDIIVRDIAILGAGASGTYAAIRLREDYNLSIAVIEKDDHIGGHTNTYTDPETQKPVDYGVLAFWDYGPAKSYFARLDVETMAAPPEGGTTVYVDSETARNVTDYQVPAFSDVLKSIAIYGNESGKYDDILLPGYWNFPSGDDIPADLLLSYGEFSQKYGIDNFYPMLQIIAGVGVGGVRDIPLLYVMGFGLDHPAIQSLLQNGLFVPKSGSNAEIYQKAYARIKDDILLSSSVVSAERDEHDGVHLVVQTSDNCKRLIKAKQLLVTPAPSIQNLESLDLDDQESAVFVSSTPRPIHVGLAKTSAIPRNYSVQYVSSKVAPDNYLDMYQDIKHDLKIQSTGPEELQLFRVLLETTSDLPLTEDEAKAYVTSQVQKLAAAGTLNSVKPPDAAAGSGDAQTANGGAVTVEFKAFKSHSSVMWRLPADEIKAGFIQNLYALQGHRSTWYTGSLWCTDFSSNVWAFTDTVLERMVGARKKDG